MFLDFFKQLYYSIITGKDNKIWKYIWKNRYKLQYEPETSLLDPHKAFIYTFCFEKFTITLWCSLRLVIIYHPMLLNISSIKFNKYISRKLYNFLINNIG